MDQKEINAKIDVISNMMSDAPEETKEALIKTLFKTLSDDMKVDITDWCNGEMGGVAARKLGRVAVKAGDKIGDVLKDGAMYVEKGAHGISAEFSKHFKKLTDKDGKYKGEKNPYDENKDA
jgi:hypothetical protein